MQNKISRKDFCESLEIPYQTLASWKTKNILPPLETINKIAEYMNVSLGWLVTGKKNNGNNTLDNPLSRVSILRRIKITLQEIYKDYEEPDNIFGRHLSDIVDQNLLINWSKGKVELPDGILQAIAGKLHVSYQWLTTADSYNQTDFNPYLYEVAKKNESFLYCLHNVTEEDLKFFKDYFNMKMWYQNFMRQKELDK